MHSSSDVMDILEMTGRDSKKMGLMAGDSAKKPVGFNTIGVFFILTWYGTI